MHRFALLALLLISVPVHADVVDSEPDDCPEGTTPDTCHGGPHCVPARCVTTDDCNEGFVCEVREYCVGTINCAGMLAPGEDPSVYDRDIIETARCGSCTDGACNEIRLCVPPLPTGDGGGGCSAGGTSSGLALVSLAMLIVLRNRRR